MDVVNLKNKFSKFSDFWSPRVIAELNDYQFKLAKFQGEFDWHKHTETDEAFIVIEGSMGIHLREADNSERTVHLQTGELFVVPKGMEHKPFTDDFCHVMMIEPKNVVNTGDAVSSDKTAANDVWI